MAPSPSENTDKLLTISLYSDDKAITDEIDILRINVTDSISETKIARIVIRDGDIEEQTFPVSDSDIFKIGKKIKFCLGYDGSSETLFEGIIVKHALSLNGDSSTLNIECESRATSTKSNNPPTGLFDINASPSLSLTYGIDIFSFSSDITHPQQSTSALIPNFNTEGFAQYQGSNKAKVGSIIELVGFGKRVSGNALVCFVEHTIDAGEWITTTKFCKQSK